MLKSYWDRNGNSDVNNVKSVNVVMVKSVNIVKINHDPDNEIDTIIWHIVGMGQVKPVNVKISAISEFPRPENKK